MGRLKTQNLPFSQNLMPKKLLKLNAVILAIGVSTILLFISSSIRHALFQSNAFDLGIFDQAVYLISQGQTPIVSFLNFHILGDHAAFIFYPLAWLYKIYPSIHWLFAIQAFALAVAALPLWYLAHQAGLSDAKSLVMVLVYLLYPLVFNINLFDFHPEVIALPTLLGAVLAARLDKVIWFSFAVILILSCKAVLSLTVAAMGIWLLVSEKKHLYGAIALFMGLAWFAIASKFIIPHFSGAEAAAVGRYAYLGNSVFEIAQNLILKPGLVLSKIFTLANLEYLVLLFIPLVWGLSAQHLAPLIGAVPCIFLNLLSESQAQKDLVHQYSLPALPFLLLVVISTLANRQGLLQNRRWIFTWSLVSFLVLAKFGYFGSKYLKFLDTWQATNEAIAQINTQGSVLAASYIAPHLTHRSVVKIASVDSESYNLSNFEYILLNKRHPGWASNSQVVDTLLTRAQNTPDFQLTYQRDDVYLFTRKP